MRARNKNIVSSSSSSSRACVCAKGVGTEDVW